MDSLGVLRNVRENELDIMLAWRNEQKVRSNMYTQHIISREEHYSWWERTKLRQDQRYYMYEYEGLPCGITSFNNIDLSNKNSAWAFYTSPSAPRGSGAKMEFLMLDLAFITLGLHKLYCEVLEFNRPVITLHHKFGFETEGVFKDQRFTNGEFINVHRLAILKTQWECNRTAQLERIIAFRSR
ncbi:UDP-4-amino-4,6-dideoxy-N-acetyl-beta-L-altrosamine N-acetyltransferase [Aeromonas media]|uniref:UDP-4-amino-4, 6-dideoxy-N-acetyl-beta-L-altrosamine N-acetyltransferase n=1 Tax=Aeromonas media TaxID=651 RepID=A0AAE7AHD5_AERME|nr:MULTISPECIES: UDP-4-amino-4,6-dideoxy-N-acetyl-beta-L-altrosamine N-acetyltransferase [Aeromonas]QJT31160.1 UDP-4-amino-4,6-dideoxy-N-acetyl-beta-L-altrosamine N-acetyltransferase [Aeromonas media]WED80042.1 UDP-4-amino-4,6-dideoxy-N-acetyl-beta-L-altrosamine N-acetyltransferase [Aeromonas media]